MNEWLNHPALKNMDPVKLELIKLAAKQTEGKNGKPSGPCGQSVPALPLIFHLLRFPEQRTFPPEKK